MRIWRGINLRFAFDDYGMGRFRFNARWKDYLFRLFGSEMAVRQFNIYLLVGLGPALVYLLSSEPDHDAIAKKAADVKSINYNLQIEAQVEVMNTIWKNRYGVNSAPTRDTDDMMTFLENGEMLNRTLTFIEVPEAIEQNLDMAKGLDSWMTENDRGLVDGYIRHKEHSHH